jgi:hypothetical protein
MLLRETLLLSITCCSVFGNAGLMAAALGDDDAGTGADDGESKVSSGCGLIANDS